MNSLHRLLDVEEVMGLLFLTLLVIAAVSLPIVSIFFAALAVKERAAESSRRSRRKVSATKWFVATAVGSVLSWIAVAFTEKGGVWMMLYGILCFAMFWGAVEAGRSAAEQSKTR